MREMPELKIREKIRIRKNKAKKRPVKGHCLLNLQTNHKKRDQLFFEKTTQKSRVRGFGQCLKYAQSLKTSPSKLKTALKFAELQIHS